MLGALLSPLSQRKKMERVEGTQGTEEEGGEGKRERVSWISFTDTFHSIVQQLDRIHRILVEYKLAWLKKWTITIMITILASLTKLQLGIKVRFKHGKDLKATKLVLWVCGDVERNPGPGNSRSEILRRFRKSQQTRILKMLHGLKGSKEPMVLYKNKPEWWPPDVPFVNISNHRGENECKECFNTLVDLLLCHKSAIPVHLASILVCFKDLYNSDCKKKQARGGRTREIECKEALVAWMDIKNTEKVLCTKTTSYYDDLRGLLCILKEQEKQGEPIPEDIRELCREIASTKSEVPEDSRLSHENSRLPHENSRLSHEDSRLSHENSRLSHEDSCLSYEDIHLSGNNMGKRKHSFKVTECAASKKPKVESIDIGKMTGSRYPLQEQDIHVRKVPMTSAVEASSFEEENKECTRRSPDLVAEIDFLTDISEYLPDANAIPLSADLCGFNQAEGTFLSTQTEEGLPGDIDALLDSILTSGNSAVEETLVQGSDFDLYA